MITPKRRIADQEKNLLRDDDGLDRVGWRRVPVRRRYGSLRSPPPMSDDLNCALQCVRRIAGVRAGR
jgi:hypothetical protein